VKKAEKNLNILDKIPLKKPKIVLIRLPNMFMLLSLGRPELLPPLLLPESPNESAACLLTVPASTIFQLMARTRRRIDRAMHCRDNFK